MSSTTEKMTDMAAQHWEIAQRLHAELRIKLKDRDSVITDIEDLIEQLRLACERTQFSDFNYATDRGVDGILWDSHSMINNRYRKINAKLKSSEQKKTVERRKWEKRYADFLKKSQFYYKGYIQRLASQFDCLKELRIIAHRLSLSTQSVDHTTNLSEETHRNILHSCHFALLRLGDLYRYRNDLNVKDRSWEKANAHYALANDLRPEAGTAFNQMAVISLADGNHLDAVYHLYRALAVDEPHSLAESNLEIEFKKINGLWTGSGHKKTANGAVTEPKTPTANMVLWFVRLHAMLYKGEDFSNHDELENEVLSQMTVLLKEQSLEDVLDKIVLINIAAEYFAGVRLTSTASDTNFQAYYFYLRLNIRMMFMLLQLLQPELDDASQGQDLPGMSGKKSSGSTETITAVTRRILPALRHYSNWMVATSAVIASQIGTASINVHIKELWESYCQTLTLLMNAFPPQQLDDVDYLLEEDAATVGFKPFRDSKDCHIYTDHNGELKKRSTDPGVERYHPNVEMVARIRGILQDGVILASSESDGVKDYPIYMIGDKFRFDEDGSISLGMKRSIEQQSPMLSPMTDSSYEHATPFLGSQHNQHVYQRPPSVEPSESQQSLSNAMHQMVEDLLTPSKTLQQNTHDANEPSYGMHNARALDLFTSMQLQLLPEHRQDQAMHSRISGFPGLTSAFAPRPGELGGGGGLSSIFIPGAGLRLPPLRPNAAPSNFAAPAAPQTHTHQHPFSASPGPNGDGRGGRGGGVGGVGAGGGSRGPWNHAHKPSPPPHAQHQPQRPHYNVAQELQKSLAAEYQASGFSHTSSLYQNTPAYRQDAPPNLHTHGSRDVLPDGGGQSYRQSNGGQVGQGVAQQQREVPFLHGHGERQGEGQMWNEGRAQGGHR